MGGGTTVASAGTGTYTGLSPRGRGNRLLRQLQDEQARSIPAWAGEPSPAYQSQLAIQVYPRVGGGTIYFRRLTYEVKGLSPRGRGNPPLNLPTCS